MCGFGDVFFLLFFVYILYVEIFIKFREITSIFITFLLEINTKKKYKKDL